MILKAKELKKTFGTAIVLNQINIELQQGSSLAIIGKSGSGKSTLLHILGTLESPDQGELFLNDLAVHPQNTDLIRKELIGFIFQNFNVLEDFSVLDNLKIASKVRNIPLLETHCLEMLQKVELIDKVHCMTKLLSGGEKQRLAIARALIHKPKLILADEPTGSLDQTQGALVETLLFDGVKSNEVSLVIVTHDLDLAKKCDRILHLKDGNLHEYI